MFKDRMPGGPFSSPGTIRKKTEILPGRLSEGGEMKTFEVYLEKYHEALVGGYTEGRHFYIEAKDAREAF